MPTVTSRDGTPIAYSRAGSGPPVILADGVLCSRAFGPMASLSALLAPSFTVFTYDRRGRNESGDTPPWSLDREVEDIAALVAEAGGSACLFGVSSGAALALEAARQGVPIARLALYEAPFIVDGSHPPLAPDFIPNLRAALEAGRRGQAVASFMALVGVPAMGRAMMRLMPIWSKLKAVAHTLPYDLTIVEPFQQGRPLPAERWTSAAMPVTRLPKPRTVRPAKPSGREASLAVRDTAQRGMSVT